jgi:hypothetical protein
VNDFVIAHGSRMLGIAEVALFTVLLIWRRPPPDPSALKPFMGARLVGVGVICVAASLLVQFPPNAFDWLTFKVIGAGTGILGAGYSLILFAAYPFFKHPT